MRNLRPADGRRARARIGQHRRAIHTVLPRVLRPTRHVRRPVLVQVPLATQHAKGVLSLAVGPILPIVVAGIRRPWDARNRAEAHRVAQPIDALLLITKIAGQTEVVTPIIQPQREQLGALRLVIDRRITLTLSQIDARTKTIALAKALTDIQVLTHTAIRADVLRVATNGLIARPLGHQVHTAAQPGPGRAHAVDERVRPLEHLDPLHRIGGNDLPRQHPIQTVVGNVITGQRQTTNHEHLRLVTEPERLPHRRIIQQHIAHVLRLLILDQLRGVAGQRERHIHVVLVAQHTHLPATRHLPTGKHLGRSAFGSLGGLRIDRGSVQHESVRPMGAEAQ